MTKAVRPASAPPPRARPHARWTIAHDALMLQAKLFLAAWHNFLLSPATLIAALLDMILKPDRRGPRFYRVLDWGRRSEEAIGLYAALHRKDVGDVHP